MQDTKFMRVVGVARIIASRKGHCVGLSSSVNKNVLGNEINAVIVG